MLLPAVPAITTPGLAFAEPPVTENELAQMRGGFSTPGGLDIAIAVQTDTKIDGNLVLRTVFTVDQGPATLVAYAPQPGKVETKVATATTGDSYQPTVNVMFDRANGVRFVGGSAGTPVVSVATSGTSTIGDSPDGSDAVAVSRDGPAVAVPAGSLTIRSLDNGARISLEGDGIAISHLVGAAFGSVIANTANDRVIDTVTTVGLDISGASIANLGSALLQVDSLGIDAAIQLMPR